MGLHFTAGIIAHPAGPQSAPAMAAAPLSQKATAKTGTVGMFTSGPMIETCPNVTQMIGNAATHAASESAATSSKTFGTTPSARSVRIAHARPY